MDDLRQGLVELRRNHPVDLDTVVEGPCERLVFHDRNVVLLRDLPDLERDQVLALCDDKRSAAFLAIIAERHGVMGRIDDDEVARGTAAIMCRRFRSRASDFSRAFTSGSPQSA